MINKFTNISVNNFQHFQNHDLVQILLKVNALIALGLFALVLPGCENRTEPEAVVSPVAPVAVAPTPAPTATVTAAPTPAPTVTVTATPAPASTVTVTPTAQAALPNAKLIGENVTVSTKVQKILTPNVFTVYDKESLRGQEVLVVSKQQAPPAGTNIELTGVVRNFVLADVNKNYGLNISPSIVTQYANKPYIDAKAIEKVD
jgi:hypothetical protein